MNTRKGRSKVLSKCQISLSENDPLERLKEFCNQGKYQYRINWDQFQNGYMCECSIYYNLGKVRTLTKEVQWVPTMDLIEAKRTVAAVCLDNMGLGVPESPPQEKQPSEVLMEMGLQAVNNLIGESQSWADIAEEETKGD